MNEKDVLECIDDVFGFMLSIMDELDIDLFEWKSVQLVNKGVNFYGVRIDGKEYVGEEDNIPDINIVDMYVDFVVFVVKKMFERFMTMMKLDVIMTEMDTVDVEKLRGDSNEYRRMARDEILNGGNKIEIK